VVQHRQGAGRRNQRRETLKPGPGISASEPDAEATVVLPTPGRRRSPFDPVLDRPAAAADLAALGGLNPLVEAANPILAAVPQIRHALRHPDPAALRKRLLEQIRAFERGAKAAGVAEVQLVMARFALCALLDDSAQVTPWGRDWAGAGLLAQVQGESSGAEKFFTLLDGLVVAPAANYDLLEFFYVCLALGFEGRYRGGEGSRQALAQARTRLHEVLAKQRPQAAPELSGRWRGAELRARRVPGALALWGAGSACVLVLAALYFAFSIMLGARSDPVARELARLKPVPLAGGPSPAASVKPSGPPSALAKDLAEAIGRREVEVVDTGGVAVIALRSDQLFAPGSARLDARLHPVILRIAEALDRVSGTIVVTGHTDDVPIRTARYPSNWELSTERARSVVGLMSSRMREPARLRAEGLADSEPVAPNDGAANRARNRRVSILLRTAP
jgi:type VI secretion system protein ImpK